MPTPSQTIATVSSREHQIQSRIMDLCAQATRCTVGCDADAEKATSLAVAIKANEKALEDDRKSLTAPLNGVVKEINERYRRLAAPIMPALEALTGSRGCLTEWNREKARQAEAAARRAREEAEAARLAEAERLEAEAAVLRGQGDEEAATIATEQAAQALDSAVEVPAEVKAAPTITRGVYGGSSGLASIGKWRVSDWAALLRYELAMIEAGAPQPSFVLADSPLLGSIARQPEAQAKPVIPGVEFYREQQTRVRG
jgi:hypothetical protein